MIYEVSIWAVIFFVFFVGLVLALSFYFGSKTKSASGYFAAGGNIHWGVNGIAFAGDYLSAASFLGICGMIAFAGYDGFLYSIGFLAGWVVALFIVAEPLKRMGKYTFADALDAKFNSKGIKLMASISTLVVSIFYLIPQMVGAGDLVVPLLGLPHWIGVIIVGSVVILIVATAGMTSTTYVQFIKGGLLIIFSTLITFFILNKGLDNPPRPDYIAPCSIEVEMKDGQMDFHNLEEYDYLSEVAVGKYLFVKLLHSGTERWYKVDSADDNSICLSETLSKTVLASGDVLYNGQPKSERMFYQVGHMSRIMEDGEEIESTGPVGPLGFLKRIEQSEMVLFKKSYFNDGAEKVTVWYQETRQGKDVMKPGLVFKVGKEASFWDKLNFASLMLALFLGTAALPHILIRYYTVRSQRAARKSTIVAIAAIGFFYILTMYMGFGAMINGVLDMESSNMSAPLLAKSFGVFIFSIVSAIAFSTVLGTVSGLIVASSGAIAHDFFDKYLNRKMNDKAKVRAGKLAAFGVGIAAILLGILFKGMNVSFLVGLAFAVAASANLPAIVMIIFWDKTTSKGIVASIFVGIVSAIVIILLSPSMFEQFRLPRESALMPFDNPGIISIPLSFITLVVVSLLTQKKKQALTP
ncbi:MAG: cation acetate symporter [Bacteroidales bacterium]|nr:cation acetate symporter [Bacteroidales bacterium]